MADFYASYPVTGGGSGILKVPTFTDLPVTADDGTLAVTLDTDTLYIYTGGSWQAIATPGDALAIGTYDSGTPSANGLHIDSSALIAQSASATVPGMVNITTQTFAGNKTFTGTISASNFSGSSSGTNTGDVTLGTANGLGLVGQVLSLGLSSTSTTGALSSTDWNTFNNKQNLLTLGNLTDAGTDGIVITGGSGAVVGSGTSISQHVADSTHNGYLSSTDWSTFNSKQAALTIGNLTDVGTDGITITSGTGAVIGTGTSISQHVADSTHNGYLSSTDWSTFNGKQASGSYITALTGEVTASGPGSVAATIAAGVITNAKVSASAAIDFSKLAALTSAHILVGSAGNVATDVAVTGDISLTNAGVTAYSGTLPLNKGGTGQTTKAPAFDALSPMSAVGDLILGSTSGTGTRLGIGSNTFVLTSNGTTASWAANAAAALVTQGAAGLVASAGQLLGISSTTDASAGNVGEYIDATVTSQTNTGNQNEFWDATSITLTAGDWDVSGDIEYVRNGATMTDIDLEVGISGTTGNSSTGLTNGINKNLWGLGGNLLTFGRITIPVGPIRVKSNGTQLIIAGTTTTGQVAYLKALIGTYSAGQPQYRASVRARRVR